MQTQEQASPAVDALVRQFFESHPEEAAVMLEQFEAEDAACLLAELPLPSRNAVWEALEPNAGCEILLHFPADHRAQLAQQVNIQGFAVTLSRMREEDREEVLAGLDTASASELRRLLSYPPDTAGHIMDTRIVAMRSGQTVSEAVEVLRRRARNLDVAELNVTDEDNKLVSIIEIKDLILAEPDKTLASLARNAATAVFPMDPVEEVVDRLDRYKLEEMPVIDREGVLLGVIRHSELIEAVKESASLDIQTMVGASKDERATSSIGFAFKKRMPWLQVNLITAFMAAAVVGLFENTIAQFTALAVLLPVVAGQSGNAGAQALAVTMRSLALREIRVAGWLRVTGKEASVGILNGLSVAVPCAVGVYLWSGQMGLVIVIATSMVLAMVMAGLAGALVPITLEKLGQDPAAASSIILTTVTDISGFFFFLGIASLLSGMLVP